MSHTEINPALNPTAAEFHAMSDSEKSVFIMTRIRLSPNHCYLNAFRAALKGFPQAGCIDFLNDFDTDLVAILKSFPRKDSDAFPVVSDMERVDLEFDRQCKAATVVHNQSWSHSGSLPGGSYVTRMGRSIAQVMEARRFHETLSAEEVEMLVTYAGVDYCNNTKY